MSAISSSAEGRGAGSITSSSFAEPFAIKVAKDSTGKTLEAMEDQPHEIITKETAYLITNMMEDVIQKGTGQAAKVIDRPIAGKTGTAQNPHGKDHAWYVGFAPFDNPRIAMAVQGVTLSNVRINGQARNEVISR